MAPPLDDDTHDLIDALLQQGFEYKHIAREAKCSIRTVQKKSRSRRQQHHFTMPYQRPHVGRPSCVTSPIRTAFANQLIETLDLYRREMARFFHSEFGARISERSIGRLLRRMDWTRKTIHRIAQQRDADNRDFYLHRIAQYKSYQLVFVDESGCDGRDTHRH
jgi:transposase